MAETKSQQHFREERRYRTTYGKNPPIVVSKKTWMKVFLQTGSVLKRKAQLKLCTRRPLIIETIRITFQSNPSKPLRIASRQLKILQSTVHKILWRDWNYMHIKWRLCKPWNLMIGQFDTPPSMLEKISKDNIILSRRISEQIIRNTPLEYFQPNA